jgi:hypothetical protein
VKVRFKKLAKMVKNGEQSCFEKDVPRRILTPNIVWYWILKGVYNSSKKSIEMLIFCKNKLLSEIFLRQTVE